MKNIITAFKTWRRKPGKLAICRAFEQGKINSKQLHELAAMLDGAHKDARTTSCERKRMMTLQEQQIAVCEKLPVVRVVTKAAHEGYTEPSTSITWRDTGFPINWPTEGLTICHEAEKLLGCRQRERYVDILIPEDDTRVPYKELWTVLHFSTEQRLNALCRVWWPERFQ